MSHFEFSVTSNGRNVKTCDFCGNPTKNGTDTDGERLCHECRAEQVRYHRQIGRMMYQAGWALPANINGAIQAGYMSAVRLDQADPLSMGW